MYQPSHFRVDDIAALHALMRAHPFATLVVPTTAGLEINHLPLHLDAEFGLLVGHVARANPVWQAAARGEAIAVFQGPQTYVTPNWYASKREHGKVVPTWNYAVVHAHGAPRWITGDTPEGDAWLHALVERLTDHHEAAHREQLARRGVDAAAAWRVDDAPADYLATMRRAIVGLELPIARLEGKFKLSQNRPAADREAVVLGLTQRGDEDSAEGVARGSSFGA
ncbi:MAG TPA: FMN-binding negative transcriptional regulator [Methylibium sp.]|uniref:FMN-binding negative transcriptional regulator n=1 Tax=Methylibium sp. TaxID=2067992 RepID=UPI002DB9B89B|nr:FMN-binding negative transcriptional regulator [Methylibium sp.]HEU4458838.1 FMN-binding negative transcriptional regulator [Methylibium sp.]